MKLSEIFRLVWLNLSQNKFKVILTSIGIIVGSATIMMVIAIGTGGRMEVAEQFKNLNAGAIDISCGSGAGSSGFRIGGMTAAGEGNRVGSRWGGGNLFSGIDREGILGFLGSGGQNRTNQKVVLTKEDCEDLEIMVPGLTSSTISYTTSASVEGGDLNSAMYYTIAGVQENYAQISNIQMAIGEFLTAENDKNKEKTCVMGATAAKDIFGSAYAAYDEVVYIDERPYTVAGVMAGMGTVASGISPDTAIFIPYETGIKYLTGNNIDPTLTVIAEDVNRVEAVMADLESSLKESYPGTAFTISDAGSKMKAAAASNNTMSLLLAAMAAIVFLVGGIGIMNVLFVSVKERTNEIGILKAIGCSRKDILLEFLLEASCTSFVGAVLGVLLSLGITPLVELLSVRVELSVSGALLSLFFGVITGTVFGFYPAYKASRLIPVEALNQE